MSRMRRTTAPRARMLRRARAKNVMGRYPSDVAQGPVAYSDVVATAFLEHLRSHQDHSPDAVFSMSPSVHLQVQTVSQRLAGFLANAQASVEATVVLEDDVQDASGLPTPGGDQI
eukprot:620676-Alexandrium_andersonii.AAC.1